MAKDTKIRRYWLMNAEGDTVWLQHSLALLEQLKYGGEFTVGSQLMTIEEWRRHPKDQFARPIVDITLNAIKETV